MRTTYKAHGVRRKNSNKNTLRARSLNISYIYDLGRKRKKIMKKCLDEQLKILQFFTGALTAPRCARKIGYPNKKGAAMSFCDFAMSFGGVAKYMFLLTEWLETFCNVFIAPPVKGGWVGVERGVRGPL